MMDENMGKNDYTIDIGSAMQVDFIECTMSNVIYHLIVRIGAIFSTNYL